MTDEPLYKCGLWIAEPGNDEFYSPGEVFIQAESNDNFRVPSFLGQGIIPDGAELIKLISLVSQEMVSALGCEKVYLVCLNEELKNRLHFRLLPRYREDKGFLNDLDSELKNTNDGLELMAKWRRQFLLKNQYNKSEYDKLHTSHLEAIKKLREALHERAITPPN